MLFCDPLVGTCGTVQPISCLKFDGPGLVSLFVSSNLLAHDIWIAGFCKHSGEP
jgi:hypothetical protein